MQRLVVCSGNRIRKAERRATRRRPAAGVVGQSWDTAPRGGGGQSSGRAEASRRTGVAWKDSGQAPGASTSSPSERTSGRSMESMAGTRRVRVGRREARPPPRLGARRGAGSSVQDDRAARAISGDRSPASREDSYLLGPAEQHPPIAVAEADTLPRRLIVGVGFAEAADVNAVTRIDVLSIRRDARLE
mmetsp:Transcript_23774/g.72725  ORF Transcript_23774/g.72725 Transcript_23774/m.72725 type:complete len:189 (+) Transcript_23774:214-780(+)